MDWLVDGQVKLSVLCVIGQLGNDAQIVLVVGEKIFKKSFCNADEVAIHGWPSEVMRFAVWEGVDGIISFNSDI